jgi:hypothetical protein
MAEDCAIDIRRLRQRAEAAGRDPASIEISIAYPGTSWGNADFDKFTRRLPSPTALESYQDMGVRRVIVSIPVSPDGLFDRALDAWRERASEVAPAGA